MKSRSIRYFKTKKIGYPLLWASVDSCDLCEKEIESAIDSIITPEFRKQIEDHAMDRSYIPSLRYLPLLTLEEYILLQKRTLT